MSTGPPVIIFRRCTKVLCQNMPEGPQGPAEYYKSLHTFPTYCLVWVDAHDCRVQYKSSDRTYPICSDTKPFKCVLSTPDPFNLSRCLSPAIRETHRARHPKIQQKVSNKNSTKNVQILLELLDCERGRKPKTECLDQACDEAADGHDRPPVFCMGVPESYEKSHLL
jgi:hypothetical protein